MLENLDYLFETIWCFLLVILVLFCLALCIFGPQFSKPPNLSLQNANFLQVLSIIAPFFIFFCVQNLSTMLMTSSLSPNCRCAQSTSCNSICLCDQFMISSPISS